MVTYDLLAWVVDALHILIIVLWLGGWFVSKDRHPTFRRVHSLFGIVILPIQAVFSFRCPMVLLSGYLRMLAHPGDPSMGRYYQPFVARLLQETFGLTVSDMCITMVIILGAMAAVWTLLTLRGRTKHR